MYSNPVQVQYVFLSLGVWTNAAWLRQHARRWLGRGTLLTCALVPPSILSIWIRRAEYRKDPMHWATQPKKKKKKKRPSRRCLLLARQERRANLRTSQATLALNASLQHGAGMEYRYPTTGTYFLSTLEYRSQLVSSSTSPGPAGIRDRVSMVRKTSRSISLCLLACLPAHTTRLCTVHSIIPRTNKPNNQSKLLARKDPAQTPSF